MRNLKIILLTAISLLLDTVLFVKLNIYGIRPDTLLAAVVCCAILSGRVTGAVMGVSGGFLIDLLFGRYLGFYAAVYMLIGYFAGIFHRKFYADNAISLAITAAITSIIKELLTALLLLLQKTEINMLIMFTRYILPSCLLTAALCAFLYVIFKPIFERQTKRMRG